MSVEDVLAQELERGPKQSAAALARAATRRLGRPISKSEVNQALYASAQRFVSQGSTPPLWSLLARSGASSGKTKGSSAKRNVKTLGLTAPKPKPKPKPKPAGAKVVSRASSGAKPDQPPASRLSTAGVGAVPRVYGGSGGRRLYAWQAEALEAWYAKSCRGVIEAVTGTGKTKVGVVAIDQTLRERGRVLVVVPTIELQKQWLKIVRQEFPVSRVAQLGGGAGERPNLIMNDVLIGVVNTTAVSDVYPPSSGGLLIADECHRYTGSMFRKVLDPSFDSRLGLSATYQRDDQTHRTVLDPYFGGTCFEIGYPRAVGDDVTAHFKVALIGVEFSRSEQALYDDISERMGKLWLKLVRDHGLSENDYQRFMAEVTRLAEDGWGAASKIAGAYVKAVADRRRLLSDTPAKDVGLRKLSGAVSSADRTILFSQTIVGAERARDLLREEGLRCECVSSVDARPERAAIMKQFASGALDAIAAPKVLDEGIDVPEADLAVIVTASQSRRQMVQRMGRVLRRKSDGRLARFALIYVKGTTEDPAIRAHRDFLDDMEDCAEEVRRFPPGASGDEITDWLNDMYPERPSAQPRFEGDEPRDPAGNASTGSVGVVVSSGKGLVPAKAVPILSPKRASPVPKAPTSKPKPKPKPKAAEAKKPKARKRKTGIGSTKPSDAAHPSAGREATPAPGAPKPKPNGSNRQGPPDAKARARVEALRRARVARGLE